MIDIKLNTIFILFLSVPISLLIWLLHNYVLKTVINVNLEDGKYKFRIYKWSPLIKFTQANFCNNLKFAN
jgi:hypothetical protein